MPFFNILSDKIDSKVPSRAKPPPPKGVKIDPVTKGPSKNPQMMAAVEAAKKRSEQYLKKR